MTESIQKPPREDNPRSRSGELARTRGDGEVLVSVDGVSKKFCRHLRRGLLYGVQDTLAELNFFRKPDGSARLRKQEFWAVDDVSFELRRGECLGLIGHNGAGKTTLLKMLNGLFKPDRGRITIRGRVGALIALGAGFNPILTGRENIYVNGSVLGLSKNEIEQKLDEIIAFAELEDFVDSPVRNYSSGMLVRLGFAIAAQVEPEVLLVDEVLAVGDIAFRNRCFRAINRLIEGGTTVILVSHQLQNILQFTERTILLDSGKILFDGSSMRACELYLERQEKVRQDAPIRPGELVGFEVDADPIIRDLHLSLKTGEASIPVHGSLTLSFSFFFGGSSDAMELGAAVYQASGLELSAMSTIVDGIKLAADNEVVEGELTLGPLGLRQGMYRLVFSIKERQEYLFRGHPIEFTVTANQVQFAIMDIQHHWKIST